MSDPALVYTNSARSADEPGTHLFIIGVGEYEFGKGKPNCTDVGGDLNQLSSPPISARAVADWFIGKYRNSAKPLASVAMLLSESTTREYVVPPRSSDARHANRVQVPRANLENVRNATREWLRRLEGNRDHMAVFYFCGHGMSSGDHAALLLDDFGEPGKEFEGAIDLTVLSASMKDCPVIQQVFFLDCCRTDVDRHYGRRAIVGSRIANVVPFRRGHKLAPQQFVLFPTINGAEAFGERGQVSVFSKSIIDALSFAAADSKTGVWRTTTGGLLTEVTRLVSLRLPTRYLELGKPNALDASSFEFNEIDEPKSTPAFVTLSDLSVWSNVKLECTHADGIEQSQCQYGRDSSGERCCKFDLLSGRWRFSGNVDPKEVGDILMHERFLLPPVAYVTLQVQ